MLLKKMPSSLKNSENRLKPGLQHGRWAKKFLQKLLNLPDEGAGKAALVAEPASQAF